MSIVKWCPVEGGGGGGGGGDVTLVCTRYIIIRRPASALLDKKQGPPGPGVPQPQAKGPQGLEGCCSDIPLCAQGL